MNATTEHQFTEKYFHEEVVRLRQAWGQLPFWMEKTTEQRQAMIDGLSFVYLNIWNEDGSKPSQEQINGWAALFQATLREYSRRETMMLMAGKCKVS